MQQNFVTRVIDGQRGVAQWVNLRTVCAAFSSQLSLSITTTGSAKPMFKLRSTLRETRPVDLISTELPRG